MFRQGILFYLAGVVAIFAVMLVPHFGGAPPEIQYHAFFLAAQMSLFLLLVQEKRKYLRLGIGIASPFFAIGNFYWREFYVDITGLYMIMSLSVGLLNSFNAFSD